MTKITNSLLKGLISFGKAFGKLAPISQIAVAGIFLVIAFSLGNCSGKSDLDTFIVEYEEFKKSAAETTKYSDSLKTIVTNLENDVAQKDETVKKLKIEIGFVSKRDRQLAGRVSNLKTQLQDAQEQADTTLILVTQDSIIATQDDQLKTKDVIIAKQDSTISIRDVQLNQMQSALRLSTMRGDSLQTLVNNLPKTPKNPNKWILGIPKPSRTTVAIVSLMAGVVVGAEIAGK